MKLRHTPGWFFIAWSVIVHAILLSFFYFYIKAVPVHQVTIKLSKPDSITARIMSHESDIRSVSLTQVRRRDRSFRQKHASMDRLNHNPARRSISKQVVKKQKIKAHKRARQLAIEKAHKRALQLALQARRTKRLERADQLVEKYITAQALSEEHGIKRTQTAQSALRRITQRKVDYYKALIIQRVNNSWHFSVRLHGIQSRLAVRLAPEGTVLDVRVVSSSGSVAFDRSAQQAIYNASPLPVPKNHAIFDTNFKHLVLTMTPPEKKVVLSS